VFSRAFLASLFLLVAFAAFAAAATPVKQNKRVILYAQFLEETQVELSDGAVWMMDKGDCFPVRMFKEQQTKVVLELGGATFWTDANRVRLMKESETATALASYRKNLTTYLKSRPEKWKQSVKGQ
jgi:hypothetical protein